MGHHTYCLFGVIFLVSYFYVLIGALLKGLVENHLLLKDEHHTPNILSVWGQLLFNILIFYVIIGVLVKAF